MTEPEKEDMKKIPYGQAIGSLTYVNCSCHPAWRSICCVTFISIPWKSRKNSFGCSQASLPILKGTRDNNLIYGINNGGLVSYTDADWASQDHRHSISGYIYQIDGGSISWSYQKQTIVALSSIQGLEHWWQFSYFAHLESLENLHGNQPWENDGNQLLCNCGRCHRAKNLREPTYFSVSTCKASSLMRVKLFFCPRSERLMPRTT